MQCIQTAILLLSITVDDCVEPSGDRMLSVDARDGHPAESRAVSLVVHPSLKSFAPSADDAEANHASASQQPTLMDGGSRAEIQVEELPPDRHAVQSPPDIQPSPVPAGTRSVYAPTCLQD